jgi:hypothetical protein
VVKGTRLSRIATSRPLLIAPPMSRDGENGKLKLSYHT